MFSQKKAFLVFSQKKPVLIFLEMELSSTNIMNTLIFYQKSISYISENGTLQSSDQNKRTPPRKNFLYFSKRKPRKKNYI